MAYRLGGGRSIRLSYWGVRGASTPGGAMPGLAYLALPVVVCDRREVLAVGP